MTIATFLHFRLFCCASYPSRRFYTLYTYLGSVVIPCICFSCTLSSILYFGFACFFLVLHLLPHCVELAFFLTITLHNCLLRFTKFSDHARTVPMSGNSITLTTSLRTRLYSCINMVPSLQFRYTHMPLQCSCCAFEQSGHLFMCTFSQIALTSTGKYIQIR